MGFITKKIQNVYIETPAGDMTLSGKSGESPEMKLFNDTIADTDDDLTNDGQFIVTGEKTRSYIQGVFGYADGDQPLIQSSIQNSLATGNGSPANVVMTDGSIYSNEILIVGDPNYNGDGTIELKFVGALDWIQS